MIIRPGLPTEQINACVETYPTFWLESHLKPITSITVVQIAGTAIFLSSPGEYLVFLEQVIS